MADVIGALRVVLGADTAALDRGLKDAQGSVAAFGNSMKIAGAVIAGALAGALGGAVAGIKGAIDEADKLGKMAQSIGLPVEALSKLKFAAELSDVSLTTLSTSMQQLNKNMVAVASGAGGKAAEAFRAMGIAVRNTDGTLKASDQILAEIADKFQRYEDGAAKAALAQAIFGRSGAAMIPMLNEGSEGLRRAADEAERFGIVISKDLASSAQNFNDNMTRMRKVLDGLFIQLAGHLAPALEEFSNSLVDSAKSGDVMKTAANVIVSVLASIAVNIGEVSIRLRGLAEEWTTFQRLLKADVFVSGEVTSAFKAWMAVSDQTDEKVRRLKQGFTDLQSAIDARGSDPWASQTRSLSDMNKELARGMDQWLRMPAPIIGTGEALSKTEQQMDKSTAAMVRWFDRGQKNLAQLEAERLGIGMSEGEYAAFKHAIEGVIEAKKNGMDQDPQTLANIQAQAVAIGEATQKLADLRVAWNFANQQGERASGLFADVVMGAKSGKDAFKEFATSIMRDVTQMIAKFIILNTVIKPIFGALTGGAGGFFGFSQGGSISMASGGSFTVPGGSSMTDNQMVPLHLASGERVTVDRPGEGGLATKVIEVVGRGYRYGRQEIEGIVEGINEATRDNIRLDLSWAR